MDHKVSYRFVEINTVRIYVGCLLDSFARLKQTSVPYEKTVLRGTVFIGVFAEIAMELGRIPQKLEEE